VKLKLKEEPREWLKFTGVMALAGAIIAFALHRKHVILREAFIASLIVLVVLVAVCAVRPRWFRGFYRAGMTASWHVGQVMGHVLLTLFFLLLVTPMGLLLRLMGKDLLELKRRPDASSYWRVAKKPGPLDRMF
jgi:hypothetical protein